VTDRSVPAVIEMVDFGLSSYFMALASEPKLTNTEEFQEAIRGLKDSKAPGPNGIPNWALCISHTERYPSWSSILTLSSSRITSLQLGSTLV